MNRIRARVYSAFHASGCGPSGFGPCIFPVVTIPDNVCSNETASYNVHAVQRRADSKILIRKDRHHCMQLQALS